MSASCPCLSLPLDPYFGNCQNSKMDLVFKALSDATRRQIPRPLREGDLSAGEVTAHSDVSKSTISGHLSVLKEAGLVDVERHGNVLIYLAQTECAGRNHDSLHGVFQPWRRGGKGEEMKSRDSLR